MIDYTQIPKEVLKMELCRSYDLKHGWFIYPDADNCGKESGWERKIHSLAAKAYVPSIIQQFFPDYHGVAYYWCAFTPRVDMNEADRALLCFGGADYKAEVWLNGVYLGACEGGETPFSFDATDALIKDGENLLAVRIKSMLSICICFTGKSIILKSNTSAADTYHSRPCDLIIIFKAYYIHGIWMWDISFSNIKQYLRRKRSKCFFYNSVCSVPLACFGKRTVQDHLVRRCLGMLRNKLLCGSDGSHRM